MVGTVKNPQALKQGEDTLQVYRDQKMQIYRSKRIPIFGKNAPKTGRA
jgi:hypothetical protein